MYITNKLPETFFEYVRHLDNCISSAGCETYDDYISKLVLENVEDWGKYTEILTCGTIDRQTASFLARIYNIKIKYSNKWESVNGFRNFFMLLQSPETAKLRVETFIKAVGGRNGEIIENLVYKGQTFASMAKKLDCLSSKVKNIFEAVLYTCYISPYYRYLFRNESVELDEIALILSNSNLNSDTLFKLTKSGFYTEYQIKELFKGCKNADDGYEVLRKNLRLNSVGIATVMSGLMTAGYEVVDDEGAGDFKKAVYSKDKNLKTVENVEKVDFGEMTPETKMEILSGILDDSEDIGHNSDVGVTEEKLEKDTNEEKTNYSNYSPGVESKNSNYPIDLSSNKNNVVKNSTDCAIEVSDYVIERCNDAIEANFRLMNFINQKCACGYIIESVSRVSVMDGEDTFRFMVVFRKMI